VNVRKYLVLLAVMCFGGTGDVLLKRGMMDVGAIDLHHPQALLGAFADPWILIGIVCLTCFFASYLTALSWADLSYVLPATAMGYVVVALLSKYFLHEHVSPWRWLGVLLISGGVGWVTRGPALTAQRREAGLAQARGQHEIA
jgi:drug/metabolite transporter (DMT)-like permease